MPRELEADVAVIGGGLAGLVAARELARAGVSPVVLEARDRVGGRTLNADLGEGKVVEIGGQWVGPTQDRVAALASELGIQTFPTHIEGQNVLELRGRTTRYSGTIPRLNPVSLAEIEVARRRIDSLAKRVPLEAPWSAPDAERLDTMTVGGWMRRGLRTRSARRLLEIAVRTVFGADPADISLLYALWYFRAGGGFDSLVDTEGGAQQDRFVGGSQLISLRVAEELGDRVVLGAPATRVEQRDGRVRIRAGDLDVAASRVIVAMAPVLCDRIEWVPGLPPARTQLAQRMPWGSYIKCIAVYDEPFWRAEGLSGEAVIDAGPATTTFDNSPPDGSPGILLAFVSGAEARAFQRLSTSQRRATLIEGLARVFGDRGRRVERYIEQDWARERFTGGGPISFMPPGVQTGFGAAIREPVGLIHWAGTETAERWSGYMDGAVRSGERAAAEVLEST